MKSIRLGMLPLFLAVFIVLASTVSVLASYYAYIYVKETDGTSYDNLPLMVSANVSQLAAGKFITSTGLDTRVLTGDGYPLPHMLAEDRILFVSDLAAYENRQLIFYTGGTSLSSFPIIVGNGGSITTPDDADLEPTWLLQFLASGHFDASAGADKNILYKEDAFRVDISGANTLRVAALEAGGGEQWALSYDSLTSDHHTVYVVTDGLAAHLYVDDFDVAKDTENLFDSNTVQVAGSVLGGGSANIAARCFYAEGRYWVVYYHDETTFRYITSTNGASWTGTTDIAIADVVGGEGIVDNSKWDAKFRDGYIHIVYSSDYADGSDRIMYRRGAPQSDGSIDWCDLWQTVMTYGTTSGYAFLTPYIAIDSDGYPTILFAWMRNWATTQWIQASSTNDGTFSSTTEWQIFGVRHTAMDIMHFPNSNELAVVALERDVGSQYMATYFRYYDGLAWDPAQPITSYVDQFEVSARIGGGMTADADGNLYVGYGRDAQYLAIRYASGVWQKMVLGSLSSSSYRGVCVGYNEDNKNVYMVYSNSAGSYILAQALDTVEWELSAPVVLTSLIGYCPDSMSAYGNRFGFLMASTNTYHTYIDLSQYVWNDNANDWVWMENNVMPYANSLYLGLDGTWQLEYQPAAIIEGTTLPDESDGGGNDGIITWGSNPDGVDVTISGILTDETEEQYDYSPHIDLGGQDIIKPEPATMTGDIDTAKLERNPFRPLALVISSVGGVTERLAWLGMGWFALIAAMLLVHLGMGTRPGQQPMHLVLTALTGFGLSVLFYVSGVFPLWPVILLAMGFLGSIVYERMPTL